MLYMFIAIILIICIIIFKHPHSSYSVIMSTEFLAIALFDVAIVLVNLMLSNYTYNYSFEYAIYQFTSALPITYFDMRMLFNISASMFLISSFSLIATQNLLTVGKHRFVPIMVYSAFTVTSFLYLNSSGFAERIYILGAQGNAAAAFLSLAGRTAVNMSVIIGISVPIIMIFRQLFLTELYINRRFLLLTLALQTVCNILFIGCIMMTPLSTFFSDFDMYKFESVYFSMFSNMTVWQLAIMLLVALGIIALSIIFNENAFYPRRHISADASLVAGEVRSIFHSCKNMMFATNVLVDKAIDSYGTDSGLIALKSIKDKNDIFMRKINHFVDIYKTNEFDYHAIDMFGCIQRALATSSVPARIRTNIIDCSYNSAVLGDSVLIEEVLINLLNNASDAIIQKGGKKKGIITIKLWNEYKWLCLSVRDNGAGISKKNRRSIFKPFFSTKKTLTGWGVGLCYSKNIIYAHGGYIDFKSKEGSFTEFQIALPIEKL